MMALLPTTQTKTNRTRAPQLLYYTAAILGAFPLRAEEDRNVAPIDRQMPFRGLAHTKWMYAPRRCALLAKKLINMRNVRWLLSRKQTNIRKVIGEDEKWLNFIKTAPIIAGECVWTKNKEPPNLTCRRPRPFRQLLAHKSWLQNETECGESVWGKERRGFSGVGDEMQCRPN